MNPLITPRVRAWRILKPMERFKAGFKDSLPTYAHQIPTSPGEELIGVYENHLGEICEAVAVTDKRLLIESGGQWTAIAYADIADTNIPWPAYARDENAAVTIILTSGKIVVMPVRGHYGKCFDLYEFSRFLSRVKADVNG